MPTSRRLILLVGPKGAGKTRIGGLLERRAGVQFVRVEPMYREAQAAGRDGQPEVIEAIRRRAATTSSPLCIETTGASRAMLDAYLGELGRAFEVLPVRVTAPADLCLRRVRGRDQTDHIPVSDDRVQAVNALAEAVVLPWAATIDTSADPDDETVLAALAALLGPG